MARHLPAAAAPLLLALLLASGGPLPSRAGEDDPPAPPAGPAPSPAPAGGEETRDPGAPPPPESLEQAWRRLEALRAAPLGGPGSFTRRMDRFRRLADQALALHARTPARGEDLHRLAEICIDGERFDEAVTAATRYIGSGGKETLPNLGLAHAIRVRALSRLGRIPEAEDALAAYRKALPGVEGIAPATKLVGDALAAAGRPADALVRYREVVDSLPRPLPAWGPGSVQALAETLVCLGRAGEARKVVAAALQGVEEPDVGLRLRSVLGRVEMTGEPFVPPPGPRWVGGPEPPPASFRGKVVVWYVYAWWMDARAETLEDWRRMLAEDAPRGLVVVPLTRTSGWDPGKGRTDPARPFEDETADIVRNLESRNWAGPAIVYRGEAAFEALRVRGVPMEVVTGRDGRIRMVEAASEPGHALALRAAALALDEPAPPPPGKDDGK